MKWLRSFGHAWQGIHYCYCKERNFRIHTSAALLVLLMSIYFQLSCFEWLIITACIVSVLILELLNTVVERLCDEICLTKKESIRRIKDMAAGAVLLAALACAIIGLLIFLPKC